MVPRRPRSRIEGGAVTPVPTQDRGKHSWLLNFAPEVLVMQLRENQ